MSFQKRFLEWIGVKQKIDSNESSPPIIHEGDIWWCGVGENVGVEICGKSKDFTRPVIVLKRFGRYGFLGIPTSTKIREGTWYVQFKHKGADEVAILSQLRVFSSKRLHSQMGELDGADFKKIKEALLRLLT